MKSLEHQCLDFWRSKPADEEYRWITMRECALGQFAAFLGIEPGPYSENYTDRLGNIETWPDPMRAAAYWCIGCPHTFGAAADRLEKLLAS